MSTIRLLGISESLRAGSANTAVLRSLGMRSVRASRYLKALDDLLLEIGSGTVHIEA